MARGLGRALQQAVSRDHLEGAPDVGGRGLANARRRDVFQYLCLRPCARIGDISQDLTISPATVRWHTWDLVENGYLQMEGARVFPAGLIQAEDAALFVAFASTGRSEFLAAASESPGNSFQEIATRIRLSRQSVSKIAAELADFGVVQLSREGRHRRVYPTDRLARKREANHPRAEAFADAFLRRLREEGLSPELLRQDETRLLLRLGTGGRRVVLEVPLDPYETAWKRPVSAHMLTD